MNIAPGSEITIEVKSVPTSAAAQKTLLRLLRKDPAAVRLQRHQKAKRPSFEEWRRGNNMWHHQMRSKPPVAVVRGAKCRIRASIDVIRDLRSVEEWVTVGA